MSSLSAQDRQTMCSSCQFTDEEIVAFADKAEQEYATGTGMMSHSDFMREVDIHFSLN